MGIIPNLGYLKLDTSGLMKLVLSANCVVRHLLYPQWVLVLSSHICHQRSTQSSRGSASKGQMQLTSYLWKSYEIFFLTICTNLGFTVKDTVVVRVIDRLVPGSSDVIGCDLNSTILSLTVNLKFPRVAPVS